MQKAEAQFPDAEEEANKAPGRTGPQVPPPCSLPHAYPAATRSALSESSLILPLPLRLQVYFLPFVRTSAADETCKISVIRLLSLRRYGAGNGKQGVPPAEVPGVTQI